MLHVLNAQFSVSEGNITSSSCHPKVTSGHQTLTLQAESSYFRLNKETALSNIRSPALLQNTRSLYCSDDLLIFKADATSSNKQGLTYRCSDCGKEYRSHGGLFLHKQHVHDRMTFPCPVCESRFTQRGKVNRHLKTVHKLVVQAQHRF